MGKLLQWVKECIEGCRTRGELNASSEGQVLLEKFAEHFDAGGVVSYDDLKDRPFYYTELTKADTGQGFVYYKVSDAVPETVPPYAAVWVVVADGNEVTQIIGTKPAGDGIIAVADLIFIATKDGASQSGVVFPERGIYFHKGPSMYVSAVAFAYEDPGANVPEKQIEWDGNPVEKKALEAKFLPDVFYTRKIDRVDGQQVDAVSGIRFANSQGIERVLWIYNDTLRVTSLDDFINGVAPQ